MKREFLAGLGLTEEAIERVMAEHGKMVQATQSKLDEAEIKHKVASDYLF